MNERVTGGEDGEDGVIGGEEIQEDEVERLQVRNRFIYSHE